MGKGNDMLEGVIILIVLIVIIIITPKGTSNSPIKSQQSGTQTSSTEKNVSTTSPYTQNISLNTGNASYAYQAYEEYITVDNIGSEPIDITNWQLKNNKDERAYNLGSDLQHFTADTAFIGRAVPFISPTFTNTFQNIILKANETAIVTTGSISSQLPYKIVSFKENICSGYLDDLPEYTFVPALNRNCPRPREEPGVKALDTECRRFIEGMSSCRTPEFNTRDTNGDICQNCVNNELLSSSCVSFIKNHFNYGSCIANHQNDSNFSGRTWRIFLGKGWEMWAKEYETIKLFDQLGRLVSSQTY